MLFINRTNILKSIFTFQTIILAGLVPPSALSVAQVALQRPMSQFVGAEGCITYTVCVCALFHWGAIGGFLMALYRLLCIISKPMEIRTLMTIGLAILFCVTTNIVVLYNNFTTWESSPVFAFCSAKSSPKVNHPDNDTNSGSNENTVKILRALNIFVGQTLLISELCIYGYIIRDLSKHDEKYYQNKTITRQMLQMRKEKNVITLRGQISSFLIESATAMFFITSIFISGMSDDTSYIPFLMVFHPTTVAISQLLTSHEMRRYVKSKFN